MVKNVDKKKLAELTEKARKYNIKESIFSYVKDTLGFQYLSPFAIAINSSNSLVAMLNSIPGLLGPLSQIIGSKQIAKKSRKKILLKSVLLES